MSIFIAVLIVAGIGSLSGQLVRNDQRSAKRHGELMALIERRANSTDVSQGD